MNQIIKFFVSIFLALLLPSCGSQKPIVSEKAINPLINDSLSDGLSIAEIDSGLDELAYRLQQHDENSMILYITEPELIKTFDHLEGNHNGALYEGISVQLIAYMERVDNLLQKTFIAEQKKQKGE